MLIAAPASVPSAFAANIFEQLGPTPTGYAFGTQFNIAVFGPSTYDVSGSVFAVRNGAAISDGCSGSSYSGFTAGAVALVSRGSCLFSAKAAFAEAAGAIGLIIGDNVAGADAPGLAGDIPIGIPTISTTLGVVSDLFETAGNGPLVVRLAAGDVSPFVLPPLLEQIAPTGTAYTVGTDFNTARFGATAYNVSGLVAAVLDATRTNLSLGCDAADFAGFNAGSIAFVSRGSCTFTLKAALAQAAGAIGILIGNNVTGDANVMGGSDIQVDIAAQSTSLELRNKLFPLALGGTLSVRLASGQLIGPAVPEPGTWLMMLSGFALVGGAMRSPHSRRRRRRFYPLNQTH